MKTPTHKIKIDGPPGELKSQTWRCTCGKWESKVPAVGPFGRTSAKARIAQVNMAHGKHVKYAEKAARNVTEQKPGDAHE